MQREKSRMNLTTVNPRVRQAIVAKGTLQKAWASVEPRGMGLTLPLMSEQLCEAMDLQPGERLLEVAAGGGTAALSAARRGCEVVATDFAEQMLDLACERAAIEQLRVSFRLADAEALPFVDRQFDSVISTFGICCAPDPQRVVHELLRVCRPGGQIGLLNWSNSSILSELFDQLTVDKQKDPLLESLKYWGSAVKVKELFESQVSAIEIESLEYRLRFRSFEHLMNTLVIDYAPLQSYLGSESQRQQKRLTSWRRRCHQLNSGTTPAMVLGCDVLQVLIVR